MTARKPDEVPMLTADMALSMRFAANSQHDLLDAEIEALAAIATGDAATYNTRTHVVVPRGEIEAKTELIASYVQTVSALHAEIEAKDARIAELRGLLDEFDCYTCSDPSYIDSPFAKRVGAAIAGETK